MTGPKQPKYTNAPLQKSIPSSANDRSNKYELSKFTWKPDHASVDHEAFGVQLIEHEELWQKVLPKLQNFASMTWNQINFQTHDGGKSSNHGLDPSKNLTSLGKNAWSQVDQEFKDMQLFSLRLENLSRIIGFRDGAIFHVIWFDSSHAFAKVTRR
jgi:hypothetical protein